MKKKYLICLIVIIIFITLVGCNKKMDNKSKNNILLDKWILNTNYNETIRDDNIKEVFESASKKYKGALLNPIALLGEQVVAGTNYMFLCYTNINNKIKFKVIVAYKDLEGNISLSNITDFDIEKYASKNNSLDNDALSGGWQVNIPGKPIMLDKDIQTIFDKAINKVTDITYYSIAVLAHQENNNYIVLCYGKLSNQNTGIFILTLNKDKEEIVSSSAVDLKDYS